MIVAGGKQVDNGQLTMNNVLRKDSEGTGVSKYLTLGTWLKG